MKRTTLAFLLFLLFLGWLVFFVLRRFMVAAQAAIGGPSPTVADALPKQAAHGSGLAAVAAQLGLMPGEFGSTGGATSGKATTATSGKATTANGLLEFVGADPYLLAGVSAPTAAAPALVLGYTPTAAAAAELPATATAPAPVVVSLWSYFLPLYSIARQA